MIASAQVASNLARLDLVLERGAAQNVVDARAEVVAATAQLRVEARVDVEHVGMLDAKHVHHVTPVLPRIEMEEKNYDLGRSSDSSHSDMERMPSTKPLDSASYCM